MNRVIFSDFAPNEERSDAENAFRLLFQPSKWRKGKYIAKLKNRLIKRFFNDDSNVFLFLTGRCGLYHTLVALNLEKGSSVLVQAFTCEAVVLPILAQNLNPIYVDINDKDYSMDLDDLTKKITPDSRVLILQHSFGITPLKRKEIITFAKKNSMYVIEDISHGFQPDLFKKNALQTTLLMSFGRSKPFSGVFGGAVVTRNKKITEYLEKIDKKIDMPSVIFIIKELIYKIVAPIIKASYHLHVGRFIHFVIKALKLVIPEISKKEKKGIYDNNYAKAMPNANAGLILEQLNRYNDVTKKRSSITEFYNIKLCGSLEGSLIRYPFISKARENTLLKARSQKIFLGTWYSQVVAPPSIDLEVLRYHNKSCPVAEYICDHIINLPTNVTRAEADRIATILD